MHQIQEIDIVFKNGSHTIYNQKTICKYMTADTSGGFFIVTIMFEDRSKQQRFFPSDSIEFVTVIYDYNNENN